MIQKSHGSSGAEDRFIDLFCETYGAEKGEYVYVQYIKVDSFCLGIYYNREIWKKDSSVYTPFWLLLDNDQWKQDEYIASYLNSLPAQMTERNHESHLFIALAAPVGCTLEETADALTVQILEHIKACRALIRFPG